MFTIQLILYLTLACLPPLTIHHCKVAPCDLAPKCFAYPNAKCVNNYCGGCFSDFYLNGRKVNCNKCKKSYSLYFHEDRSRVFYNKDYLLNFYAFSAELEHPSFQIQSFSKPLGLESLLLNVFGIVCNTLTDLFSCIFVKVDPCAVVRCRNGTKCMVQNGQANCVPGKYTFYLLCNILITNEVTNK